MPVNSSSCDKTSSSSNNKEGHNSSSRDKYSNYISSKKASAVATVTAPAANCD